jgi:raffinose/stachyose/melibiose transport system substrate-binding protein
MYNKDAIKEATGKEFDPASVQTLDDFKALLEEMKKGGMESPVGIMKEDWSLAAHYFQEVYETQPDPEAFVQSLYAGKADLANNDQFNSYIDTFDVLKDYNYKKKAPLDAEREVSEQYLAEGKIAFMFGGNWDWSQIVDFNEEANLGLMPVPRNTTDDTNTKLVGGGSKYLFIDSSDAFSEEQIAAAKDFLNWLVSDAEGNAFLTEKCAVVPAFDNVEATKLDPLSASVKEFADAGALIPNYNYDPDDHISKVGQIMQKYLGGKIDRKELAKDIGDYWSSTKPVEH